MHDDAIGGIVIPGLVPGIHVSARTDLPVYVTDARDKPGHDA